MAITMRKGRPEDFDPSKMLPGEFGVTIGTDRKARKLYICFAPGIVKQLGTYEDFGDQIQDATEEIKQQYLTAFNEILTQIESDKNTAAEEYAYVVDFKNLLDETYVPDITKSVTAASNSATAAAAASNSASTYKDNAKTYMDNANAYSKEAKTAASSITGALKPKGTIAFKDLPNLSTTDTGAMYNISDEFVSTDNFKDGGEITYPAGTNIYKTEDGMWDCLGGQLSDYLMRDDIDTAVEEAMPDYTASTQLTELVAGEKMSTALGKIKTAVKNVISLVKLLGTTDISGVGNGTVTGAISSLNSNISDIKITTKLYSVTLTKNSLVSPYSYYGVQDCTEDVNELGNIICATLRDQNAAPKSVNIINNLIAMASTSDNNVLTVKFLKLP